MRPNTTVLCSGLTAEAAAVDQRHHLPVQLLCHRRQAASPPSSLTYLAVVRSHRLAVPPDHVGDVGDDVLEGRQELHQLGLDGLCIVHVGDGGACNLGPCKRRVGPRASKGEKPQAKRGQLLGRQGKKNGHATACSYTHPLLRHAQLLKVARQLGQLPQAPGHLI